MKRTRKELGFIESDSDSRENEFVDDLEEIKRLKSLEQSNDQEIEEIMNKISSNLKKINQSKSEEISSNLVVDYNSVNLFIDEIRVDSSDDDDFYLRLMKCSLEDDDY